MTTISNKTIIGLLTVALLITVAGTVISVSKLRQYNSGLSMVSGAVTDTAGGNATITIASVTHISNSQATIAFGSGYLNGSGACSVCRLDSNGTRDNLTCCVSFTTVTNGFQLENTGNENLSVNFSCAGSCTNLTFITAGAFEIKVRNSTGRYQTGEVGVRDTNSSCIGVEGVSAGLYAGGWNGWNITQGATERQTENFYVPMSASAWLCGNSTTYPLEYADTYDAAVIDLNVTITPSTTAGAGAQTATFTFSAVSTG